jgi:hypothetical protein
MSIDHIHTHKHAHAHIYNVYYSMPYNGKLVVKINVVDQLFKNQRTFSQIIHHGYPYWSQTGILLSPWDTFKCLAQSCLLLFIIMPSYVEVFVGSDFCSG